MVLIYSIEGSIGSGKSTIVEYMKSTIDEYKHLYKDLDETNPIIFLDEPINVWNSIIDPSGETILEKFYKDQEKYSFPFQMMAYITRISMLKKAVKKYPNSIIVCERSVWTDRYVFAKMLFDTRKIETINFTIYIEWFNEFIEDIPIHRFIYMKASGEKCHERIIKRNRKGETIPIDYSKRCVEYHDSWLDMEKKKLVIDCNDDVEDNELLYKKFSDSIHDFIQKTKNEV